MTKKKTETPEQRDARLAKQRESAKTNREVKKAKATPEQREALLSEERAEYKKRRAAFFGPVQSTMARLSVSGGGGLLNVL
jgi:hypothetical protein